MFGRKKMTRRFFAIAKSLPTIIVMSVAIRVAFAIDQARQLPANLRGLVPFLNEAGNIAFSLAKAHGFSSPWWQETGPTGWLTPVYPWIVAIVYRLFGIHTPHAFYAAVLLNIIFSAATCVPIYFIGKKIAGSGVGYGAAWLWAIFPNAILIPYEWIWDTSLSALLMAMLLWATLALPEAPRWRPWMLYGVLWGFALMTNPAVGSMLPLLLGWAAYRALREHQIPLIKPALALGIAILCCLPWSIRNYVTFHKLIPLRSNFALELWAGNNESFDPSSQTVPPSDPQREELRKYIRLGETAYMAEKWQIATAFIRTHPRLEAVLWWRRFVATWTGSEAPLQGFQDAETNLVRVVLVTNLLVGLGTLAGILTLIRSRSIYTVPLAGFPIVYPLIYYATHPSLRYRHPIDPVLLILVAVAIAGAIASHRASPPDSPEEARDSL
jgi:4-amino-4-deoxy-L-arabinose transferase-like glycosyltransferase